MGRIGILKQKGEVSYSVDLQRYTHAARDIVDSVPSGSSLPAVTGRMRRHNAARRVGRASTDPRNQWQRM